MQIIIKFSKFKFKYFFLIFSLRIRKRLLFVVRLIDVLFNDYTRRCIYEKNEESVKITRIFIEHSGVVKINRSEGPRFPRLENCLSAKGILIASINGVDGAKISHTISNIITSDIDNIFSRSRMLEK